MCPCVTRRSLGTTSRVQIEQRITTWTIIVVVLAHVFACNQGYIYIYLGMMFQGIRRLIIGKSTVSID